MAKKAVKCEKCIYNGDKCGHESNKGILIRNRLEKIVLFQSPKELNKDGNCINYVEFSEK